MRHAKSNQPVLSPLRKFDFGLIKAKLDGLLFNVSRSLERGLREASASGNLGAARDYTLLLLFVHVAINSYNAVRYLINESGPKDYLRKPAFMFVVPSINRQLMDMLFTLVYMLDDFPHRRLMYERASFREFYESTHRFRTKYKRDPEWKHYFRVADALRKQGISELGITSAEIKNPKAIRYWPHPGGIEDEPTASRPFLRWFNEWVYRDTSAEAHVSPFGLSAMARFFLTSISNPDEDLTTRREYQIYKFVHFSRTTLTVLAVATELNSFFKLGCDDSVGYLWKVMCEHVADAQDAYEKRYSSKI